MSIAPQQISSKLRMMPDQELQQYAAMHQNDPYIFPLAFQESQDRKQMRAEAMAQQAGQAKPPVVQQDLAQMAPPQAPNMPTGIPLQGAGSMEQAPEPEQQATKLPEEHGIGALPANNLKGMKEGGITGYDSGGTTYSPDVYRRYAIQQAQKMGLPPEFVDTIFHNESGYNPNAKSKTGPVGIGQLAADTSKGYGLKPEERTNGFKNIDASLAFMKDLQGKYNGDIQKMAVAYNQGEPFLNDHLKANNGQLVPSNFEGPHKIEAADYLKKLNDYLPLSTAEAKTTPPVQAPAQAPAQTQPQSLEKIDTLGKAALMSAGNVPMGVAISEPIARLAHEALFAPQFKPGTTLSEALGRIGLAGLVPSSVLAGGLAASKNAMNNLGYLPPDQRNELANNPMLSMMSGDVGLASAITDAAANNPEGPSNMPYAEQMKNALVTIPKAIVSAPNQNKQNVAVSPNNLVKPLNQPLEASDNTDLRKAQYAYGPEDAGSDTLWSGVTQNAPSTPTAPSTNDIAKTVTDTPNAKGGRDWNDFLLNMGLGLMAGKSPYALQNLGEAGIGALRQEQEAKKQALEERKIASEEAYQKALSAHYGVTPEIQLVQAMKDPEFAKQYQSLVSAKSGPMTQKDLIDNYMKTLKGQAGDFSGLNDFIYGTMPSGVTVTKRGG